MEKPTNKSNESTISTTGTTGTPPYSDTMDNNVKYMNLNFIDNSESSSQAKEAAQEFKTSTFEPPKVAKPPPSKIRPSNLPYTGKMEPTRNKIEPNLQEKSLLEMGFKCTEIEGWENIVQPPKENLYKLLKNMIDNHIKPNVQIRIGGVTFNCHMMVLQCYSDFFMECNNEVLIQLPEEKITPGAFMMVYDWMLAEEPLVQREGILELFNAANFLRIKDLVNQCWLCLDDDVRFREDTAFLLYLEARNYGLESLEQLMLTRICKFFLTLVSSKEFLQLNSKEICTLLSSNTIGVNSEIEIFMSVVRWLSKNWTEREPHMLKVIKCVRFSLMPPWFLVTLNKNTDCIEIDRIVSHPEVKKMINDGISFTTTQLYYGESREEFLHFLERYQLVAPMQRQWVFDKECSYHHRLECPNMQYVTYKSFLEYLEMIQTIGKNYWRTLEMAKGVEKTLQCCVRTDCRKTNEQNLASVYTKKSRDQGIQAEVCVRSQKGHIRESRECIGDFNRDNRIKNTISSKTKFQSKIIPSDKHSTSLKSCCNSFESVEKIKFKHQVNKNQTEKQVQTSFYSCNKSLSNEMVVGKKSITDMAPRTVVNDNDIFNGNDNDLTPNISRRSCCQNNINNIPDLTVNSVAFAISESKEDVYNEDIQDNLTVKCDNEEIKQQTLVNTGYHYGIETEDNIDEANNIDSTDMASSSPNSVVYKGFEARKILIFGGIDPYCQHCLHDDKNKSQKWYEEEQKFKSHPWLGNSGLDAYRYGSYGDQVLNYDFADLEWKHLSFIPFGSRHHHSAVLCNGLIFVIGGTRTALGCTKKSIFEKSIWSLDPQDLKWTLESHLPESRRDFAVIVIDDCSESSENRKNVGTGFYIIGGEGINGAVLDTVWFYDIKTKIWTKKASLNLGRYGLAAVLVNNEIWVGGGIVSDETSNLDGGDNCYPANAEMVTDAMEYYSLKSTNNDDSLYGIDRDDNGISWILSNIRLRIPRLFGRFCKTINKEVYLVGGIGISSDNVFISLSSVDLFDRQNEKCVFYGDILSARHGHDVVSLNDKIIIVGGVSTMERRTLTSVESFCTKSRKSSIEIAELPWPLSGSAVVAL